MNRLIRLGMEWVSEQSASESERSDRMPDGVSESWFGEKRVCGFQPFGFPVKSTSWGVTRVDRSGKGMERKERKETMKQKKKREEVENRE